MERNQTTYIYTPLDERKREIRLLHLHPGFFLDDKGSTSKTNDDDPTKFETDQEIHCTISLASLNDGPIYEALSYVWGDPQAVIAINLDVQQFYVTENLHCALRYLRLNNQERVPWIDALCIDQNDFSEKDLQVAQMGDVYKSASLVVVFLGAGWKGSDHDLEILKQVGTNPEVHLDYTLGPHFTSAGKPLPAQVLTDSMRRVFESPWFNRLWTGQEYVLARQLIVQCGHKTISQKALHGLGNYLIHHLTGCCNRLSYVYQDQGFYRCATHLVSLSWLQDKDGNITLFDLLVFLRNHDCHDARDKVYGVLGMARPIDRVDILPDYEKDLAEVYADVLVSDITRSRSLDILTFGHGAKCLDAIVPSYDPDWRAGIDRVDFSDVMSRNGLLITDVYSASEYSAAELQITSGHKAHSQGIVLDRILTTIALGRLKSSAFVEKCRAPFESIADRSSPYQSTKEAFWRTLCGGLINEEQNRYLSRKVTDEDYWMYKKWTELTEDLSDEIAMTDGISYFNSMFARATVGRDFILTEKGFIGFEQTGCTEGDVIAILSGGKVPYILRPILKGEESETKTAAGVDTYPRFTFIGDAYVHGIMDGEAWEEEKLKMLELV